MKTCAKEMDGCCTKECKETLHMPIERQKELRKGIENGNKVFNKSKSRLRPRLDEINKLKD
ncbi:MAG: hypothetical protein V9E96_10415 [Chitinophagaceae bacterium]